MGVTKSWTWLSYWIIPNNVLETIPLFFPFINTDVMILGTLKYWSTFNSITLDNDNYKFWLKENNYWKALWSNQEKAVAPHSSTLAWKIPWTEEPGRRQSMWSLRVGHDWATSLSLFTFMHWRRKWQPTPVFLPGESQGQGSLVGCRLWGHTESDTTEVT